MGEYAQSGVNYDEMGPFKALAIKTAKRTIEFPERHYVIVNPNGTQKYFGDLSFILAKPVLEGLGNKNWIAEWMYQFAGDGKSRYHEIGICNTMMAVNDIIVQGAMPITYNDEVAAGDSAWFTDLRRAKDFFDGIYDACRMSGMALVGGESPSLKYLVRSAEPVESAPILSGAVTGIIAPGDRYIDGSKLAAGDCIIGITSSGLHANGISLVIKRGVTLPDKFLTKLPNGNTLGDEALIPTRCYVDLVEGLMDIGVDVHAFQPGTGSGVAKIAFDPRPFTYRIHSWPEVPLLFKYMQSLGVSDKDCVTTFNWGVGYYVFVPPHEVERTLRVAKATGYEALLIGRVEEGERKTLFGPMNDMPLAPPPH